MEKVRNKEKEKQFTTVVFFLAVFVVDVINLFCFLTEKVKYV